MMHTRVVSDNGLKATASGFAVDVRLPWYRSLPLSVVEIKSIELDGKPIDLGNVQIEINGRRMPLSDLRPLTREFWYVLDSAQLHVAHATLPKGTTHDVAVTIAVRPPYVPGYVRITHTQKQLTAR